MASTASVAQLFTQEIQSRIFSVSCGRRQRYYSRSSTVIHFSPPPLLLLSPVPTGNFVTPHNTSCCSILPLSQIPCMQKEFPQQPTLLYNLSCPNLLPLQVKLRHKSTENSHHTTHLSPSTLSLQVTLALPASTAGVQYLYS